MIGWEAARCYLGWPHVRVRFLVLEARALPMLGFGNFLNILRSGLTRAQDLRGQRRRGTGNKPATITGLPPVNWDRD